MSFRFQADADIDPDIVRGLRLREPAIDFREAVGVIPDGTPDPEVLLMAADSGRVLVSGDARTMPGHLAEFVVSHDSPGVILIPSSGSIREAIDGLLVVWLEWRPGAMRNQARWLPRPKAS